LPRSQCRCASSDRGFFFDQDMRSGSSPRCAAMPWPTLSCRTYKILFRPIVFSFSSSCSRSCDRRVLPPAAPHLFFFAESFHALTSPLFPLPGLLSSVRYARNLFFPPWVSWLFFPLFHRSPVVFSVHPGDACLVRPFVTLLFRRSFCPCFFPLPVFARYLFSEP